MIAQKITLKGTRAGVIRTEMRINFANTENSEISKANVFKSSIQLINPPLEKLNQDPLDCIQYIHTLNG